MDKRSLIFIFVMTTVFLLMNNYWFDRKIESNAPSQTQVEQVVEASKPAPVLPLNEDFYVLQNEKQQVVFSTLEGAIAEINLVVTGDIEKIGVDQQIAEKSPQNAYFPNFPYHIVDASGKETLQNPTFGGHTPLLRRSLKNEKGELTFRMQPSFYATALLQEEHHQTTPFEVVRFSEDTIEFISKSQDRTIHKTYHLSKEAPYSIELELQVEGNAGGLWLSSGITEVDLMNGVYSPLMQYNSLEGKKHKLKKISLPSGPVTYDSVRPIWSGISNGFFGLIIDSLSTQSMGMKTEKIDGEEAVTRLSLIDPDYKTYPAKKFPGYEILTPYKMSSQSMKYLIYAGPFDKKVLSSVDQALSQNGTNDELASAMSYSSWLSSVIDPFAKFLSIFLNMFYSLTRSWGFSIILLTLLLRVLVYPLNQWALKSQKRMQEIAPKQKAIQDKYKSDPKRMQMEMAMLYRNERVNPFMGCLPMLLQFPFLIGMYQLLQSNYALRGASFVPGWIENLAAPDVLFSWGTPLPFLGSNFHLLPLILGALTYVQGKMNSWMQEQKGELTDQQKQMNSMATILPIVMIFIFYNMASGLNIYWIFSSLFGIVQQWFVMRVANKKTKTKKAR